MSVPGASIRDARFRIVSSRLARRLAGRRGLALVAVLWGLTLLALMTASFTSTTRTEVNLAFNALESARAELIAEAGVHRSILGLLAIDQESEAWRADGSVYGWRFEDSQIRVSVQDEGGKIDLNAVQPELLRALFLSVEVAPERADALVDAILDFRDSDDLRQQNGAEDDDYVLAGLQHDAKDAPFDSIEELNQVFGMSAEVFRRVAPALTVYSGRPEPFAEVAPPVVQAAIEAANFSLEAEELAEAGSEGEDGGIALEPDFDTLLGDASADLTEPVDSTAPVLLREGRSDLRSGTPAFAIHAEARVPSGAVFVIETVVQTPAPDGRPYSFLTWRRGERRYLVDPVETAEVE